MTELYRYAGSIDYDKIADAINSIVVEDGFDDAYKEGWRIVLNEAGDGGISEIYFKGIFDALEFIKNSKEDKGD